MKKVMLVLLIAVFSSTVNYTSYGKCNAVGLFPVNVDWPDVAPVYNSYYNYSTNMLHIYGGMFATAVNVVVTHNGVVVLSDIVTPDNLPAIYDFTDSASGTYHVTVSVGTTILSTFSFEKF